jgi:hypothetical protein
MLVLAERSREFSRVEQGVFALGAGSFDASNREICQTSENKEIVARRRVANGDK